MRPQLGECDCLVVSGYNTQYYMFERKRLIEACKSLRVNESELLLIDLFISESKWGEVKVLNLHPSKINKILVKVTLVALYLVISTSSVKGRR